MQYLSNKNESSMDIINIGKREFVCASLTTRLTTFWFIFLAILLLLLLKAPDSITNPQFWAEDGVVFFQQQFGHTLPRLFNVYNGYLLVIPRLTAWVATFLPYQYSPLAYNIVALWVDAAAITFFSVKSKVLVPTWITIMVFMLTPSNDLIFGNLTNVQWFLQFALFAAIFYPAPPRRLCTDILPIIAILAISLTGPFSVFCAFIALAIRLGTFVVRSCKIAPHMQKTLETWWTSINKRYLAATGVGAAIQLPILLLTPHTPSGPFSFEVAKLLFLKGTQFHTFGNVLLPDILIAIFAVILLICAIPYFLRYFSVSWLIICAMTMFAALQLLGISSKAALSALVSPVAFTGDRYYFFAKVAFWICLTLVLSKFSHGRYSRPLFLLAPTCLVFIALLNVDHLRRPPLPDLHWKQASAVLSSGQRNVAIPINPAPWEIRLTLPSKSAQWKRDGGS